MKNNNQQQNKKSKMTGRDAINRVSTKASPPLEEGTEGWSEDNIAVKVTNVSKIFKIPHTKIDSMCSMFVNMYKKRVCEKNSTS